MSRKHPQNGPSFGKATYRAKPLTEEEIVAFHAREKAREAEGIKRTLETREYNKKVKNGGHTLSVR